jgi:hypothetical protein
MKLFNSSVTLAVVLCLAWPCALLAREIKDCSEQDPPGTECTIKAEDLRPTQFALGFEMVQEKVRVLNKLSKDKRRDYLRARPVPVVIGPGGLVYAIDHHHLTRAVLDSGHSKMMARVQENWLALSAEAFWRKMQSFGFVYLYDAKGRGPLSPLELPTAVLKMSDDPYRSLAALAREEGCYKKSRQPFAEFAWAQYFRPRVLIDGSAKKSVPRAMPFCHESSAAHLPGFIRL